MHRIIWRLNKKSSLGISDLFGIQKQVCRIEGGIEMAQIGVIVPVYNAERYLRKCVESILNQSFPDFELILIDDGSMDASGRICDEYAKKHKNVRVIHSGHIGVAAIRNRGVDENTSEYITFVDSDDYIDRNYLETLYQLMLRNKADLVISCGKNLAVGREEGAADPGSIAGTNRAGGPDSTMGQAEGHIASKSEVYKRMFADGQTIAFVWGKLYHRNIFQSIRFPDGEIYEDMKVAGRMIESSHRIVYTSYAGYYYVQTPNSITRGGASLEHMALLKNEKQLLEFINQNHPDISREAKKHYFWSCFFVLSKLAPFPQYKQECHAVRKEIVKEWKFLIFGRETRIMVKAATACLLFGLPCYRFVWGICQNNVMKRLIN